MKKRSLQFEAPFGMNLPSGFTGMNGLFDTLPWNADAFCPCGFGDEYNADLVDPQWHGLSCHTSIRDGQLYSPLDEALGLDHVSVHTYHVPQTGRTPAQFIEVMFSQPYDLTLEMVRAGYQIAARNGLVFTVFSPSESFWSPGFTYLLMWHQNIRVYSESVQRGAYDQVFTTRLSDVPPPPFANYKKVEAPCPECSEYCNAYAGVMPQFKYASCSSKHEPFVYNIATGEYLTSIGGSTWKTNLSPWGNRTEERRTI